MRSGKIAVAGLVSLVLSGCGITEVDPVAETPRAIVSRNLHPLWILDADAEGAPVRAFSRKSFPPVRRPTPLRFRSHPPRALPWGDVLCTYEGRMSCISARTGKERWSVEVETGEWLQLAVYGPRIFVYEGGGRIRIFTADGKSLGEREVVSNALLDNDQDRLYLLSPSGIQAFSTISLNTIWSWHPSGSLQFLSMVIGRGRVAVEYYSPSVHHHETALLNRKNGLVRNRFLGRALGWSGDTFVVLRDWKGEVWGWNDQTGKFQWAIPLNAFDGRAILLHEGDLIYSSENHYFRSAVTRIGPGGMKQEPRKVEIRREIQKEGQWRVPFRGRAVLQGDVIFDLHSEGLNGWKVSDGSSLYEVRVDDPPEQVSLGQHHLFVLTRSGILHAFAIRK